MYRSFLTLITTLIIAFNISALTVVSSPGKLAQMVESQNEITDLVITGSVNAADFEFIQKSLPELAKLDLSGVSIAEYSGEPLETTGRTFSAANTLPAYALFGSRLSTVILPESLESIGEAALAGSSVKELVIPQKVKSIENRAFAGSALEKIEIPVNVTTFGEGIFRESKSLAAVEYRSLSGIALYSFFGCSSLETVSLPSSLKEIGEYAFAGTSSLKTVEIPVSVKGIGAYAFTGSGLTAVNLEDNLELESLGEGAFENCTSLTEARLPESLTTISNSLFLGDKALVDIVFPEKIETVGRLALANNENLEVSPLNSLEPGINSIDDYSMAGMSSVKDIYLPNTLVYIGKGAMEGMKSLENVYATTLTWKPELGEDVWKDVDQKNAMLYVDEIVADEYAADPQWGLFKITRTTSVVDVVKENISAFKVNVRINANTLTVDANKNMASIAVYDISGRNTARLELDDTFAQISLDGMPSAVYIIDVYSADNERETFKLVKK